MSQSTTTERRRLSPRVRSTLKAIIAIIAIVVIGTLVVIYGPKEGDSDNVTGDLPETPTVTITNLVSSQVINRGFDYNGVHITLTKAMLATKFSDDRSRGGTYVVRIMAETKSSAQKPVGVQYADLARLVLPDGQLVRPKRISITPLEIPDSPQSGFLDFPVSSQVPLSQLKFQFNGTTVIPFSG